MTILLKVAHFRNRNGKMATLKSADFELTIPERAFDFRNNLFYEKF